MPDVRIDREGDVVVLTIDRPHARNAIGLKTMDELDAALEDLAQGDARCAVLTGAGERAFVAGGDLRELETVNTEEFAVDMALRMRHVLDRIATVPIPVICALNGAALGGGAETAIACDYRIAADDARIGFTQVLLGVMPAWGGIERLCNVVGRARAMYLLTTGATFSGQEAFAMGLVEESVPRSEFEARWRAVAHDVAQAPRSALEGIKRAVDGTLPANRPATEAAAVRDFARAWADPRHWEMAAALEAKRREARRAQ